MGASIVLLEDHGVSTGAAGSGCGSRFSMDSQAMGMGSQTGSHVIRNGFSVYLLGTLLV